MRSKDLGNLVKSVEMHYQYLDWLVTSTYIRMVTKVNTSNVKINHNCFLLFKTYNTIIYNYRFTKTCCIKSSNRYAKKCFLQSPMPRDLYIISKGMWQAQGLLQLHCCFVLIKQGYILTIFLINNAKSLGMYAWKVLQLSWIGLAIFVRQHTKWHG